MIRRTSVFTSRDIGVALVLLLLFCTACDRGGAQAPDAAHPGAGGAVDPPAYLESIVSIPVSETRPPSTGVERTSRGTATKRLKAGHGSRRATSADAIVLYIQTYDEQGRILDRGKELISDFEDDLSPEGREVVQMMTEGEVRRIWFPGRQESASFRVTDYELVYLGTAPTPDHR